MRAMERDDFTWAAELMERRRQRYAEYSPDFWRPATNVRQGHASFMESTAARPDAVAVRTDHGFLIGAAGGERWYVDDFAVEPDELWMTEGAELLHAGWGVAGAAGQTVLRVVTARRDGPKRALLQSAGLTVSARWWVKRLVPTGPPQPSREYVFGGCNAFLGPAPPVYDPGGPVCLFGDTRDDDLDQACEGAASLGAVLAIIQRDEPGDAPDSEPQLESRGFHNPSEFFQGSPYVEPSSA